MTSRRMLVRLDCLNCGPSSLHNERHCVSCLTPHATQGPREPDAWMRDFIERSNRAREKAAIRNMAARIDRTVQPRKKAATEKQEQYNARRRAARAMRMGPI